MREEVRSSGTVEPPRPRRARSPSPPATPAASSAGASSPVVHANVGSNDWLGQGLKAGSQSCVGPLQKASLSATGVASALGSAHALCRPWDRGDLLRRLATFNPSSWPVRAKAAGSLACARWGWTNVASNMIECDSCGVQLQNNLLPSLTTAEADKATEAFSKELDSGHKLYCPWKGNCCAESLVQFPPTPPSALIDGYKDRCDGLSQFVSLPVVASSAIQYIKSTRGPQVARIMAQTLPPVGEFNYKAESTVGESYRDQIQSNYGNAQKLISLCGWEPRWLPNVQDCEEHSAHSARNDCFSGPREEQVHLEQAGITRSAVSVVPKRDTGKMKEMDVDLTGHFRLPILDCSLCGATVRVWDFQTIPRPPSYAPNNIGPPEMPKKMGLVRGASAASGINGWLNEMDKEQVDVRDEVATLGESKSQSNAGVDLNLTMAGGLPSTQLSGIPAMPEQYSAAGLGRDLMIGQPAGSEVGDRAASYESCGPSSRKRSFGEGGSTVDPPHPDRMQHEDSVEGTVIDREEEVNDNREISCGPSKRIRETDFFSPHRMDAGPSYSHGFELDLCGSRVENLKRGLNRSGYPSTRDSARASSVIAMDTMSNSDGTDSMDSVENYPADMDDVHLPSSSTQKNIDLNDASELNYSNQAQLSTCVRPDVMRVGELGESSTFGEEIMNTDAETARARNLPSFGMSGGGSVGMGVSTEAEMHGLNPSVQRGDSCMGDAEQVAEITENAGQTGEFIPDPGLMDEFVPEDMNREDMNRDDPHGDSQDVISPAVEKADSGSKVDGYTKAESVESREKGKNVLRRENSPHLSLSYNAVIYSACEVSKEEVTQAGKASFVDDSPAVESAYAVINVVTNGESNYEAPAEFDPIKSHNPFCPWVNANVAAAGCSSDSSGPSSSSVALCGWQLTVDALDSFLGHLSVQPVESESAASMYKDNHFALKRKSVAHH